MTAEPLTAEPMTRNTPHVTCEAAESGDLQPPLTFVNDALSPKSADDLPQAMNQNVSHDKQQAAPKTVEGVEEGTKEDEEDSTHRGQPPPPLRRAAAGLASTGVQEASCSPSVSSACGPSTPACGPSTLACGPSTPACGPSTPAKTLPLKCSRDDTSSSEASYPPTPHHPQSLTTASNISVTGEIAVSRPSVTANPLGKKRGGCLRPIRTSTSAPASAQPSTHQNDLQIEAKDAPCAQPAAAQKEASRPHPSPTPQPARQSFAVVAARQAVGKDKDTTPKTHPNGRKPKAPRNQPNRNHSGQKPASRSIRQPQIAVKEPHHADSPPGVPHTHASTSQRPPLPQAPTTPKQQPLQQQDSQRRASHDIDVLLADVWAFTASDHTPSHPMPSPQAAAALAPPLTMNQPQKLSIRPAVHTEDLVSKGASQCRPQFGVTAGGPPPAHPHGITSASRPLDGSSLPSGRAERLEADGTGDNGSLPGYHHRHDHHVPHTTPSAGNAASSASPILEDQQATTADWPLWTKAFTTAQPVQLGFGGSQPPLPPLRQTSGGWSSSKHRDLWGSEGLDGGGSGTASMPVSPLVRCNGPSILTPISPSDPSPCTGTSSTKRSPSDNSARGPLGGPSLWSGKLPLLL